jgi:hypothetical protein
MSGWRQIAAEARRSGTTPQKILQKIYDGKLFAVPLAKEAKKNIQTLVDVMKKVRH